MFKKNAVFLLIIAGTICCKANDVKSENLIRNHDFTQGFKYWHVPLKKSSNTYSIKNIADKNILIIKGAPELGEKNNYVKCACRIKLTKDKISAKKFTFGVSLKAIKVSGQLTFAVREIDAAGKTITYQAIKVKKRDKYDWKKFSKTFSTSPKTVKLAFYIISRYLQKEDEIQAKDIFLYSKDQNTL